MITAYELKNRKFCRFFYKIPYFVKNIALLLLLFAILLPIYFAHFRRESLGYTTVYKLLMGLNSKTFNYLQSNSDNELQLKGGLRVEYLNKLDLKSFYSRFVSYSKACVIKDGAKDWPAMNKWRYQNDGYAYLGQTLRSLPTSVYVDPDATSTIDDFSGFTFKEDSVEVMKFNTEFL